MISAVLTIGLRLSGLMLFAPFFGSAVDPAADQGGLVMALTAVLYPVLCSAAWQP